MKRPSKLAAVVAVGIFALSYWAAAQTESSSPLKFSFNVKGEYTDNRDSAPDGEEEDNMDFFFQPRLDFIVKDSGTILDLYYMPSFRYRTDPADYQDDTEILHDLGLNLKHALTPSLSFRAIDHFNITDDPAIERYGNTLKRDSTFTRNDAEAGLTYDISRETTADVMAQHMIKQYDEKDMEWADKESLSGALTLWHQIQRTVGFSARAVAGTFEYDADESVYGGDRDYDSVAGILGLDKMFSSNLRGSLRAGFTSFSYSDDDIDSESAPMLSAAIEGSTTPAARIKLGVGYSLRDSEVYPFASQKETDASVQLEWDVSPKLMLGVAGRYRLGDYSRDSVPGSVRRSVDSGSLSMDLDGEQTTAVLQASARLALGALTSVQLVQSYEDVDADFDDRDTSFTRNATSLMLTRNF